MLVLLPLTVCFLRLAVALFEPNPPLDEVLLAAAIAAVCVVIVVVEIRKRHQASTPPKDRDER